MHETLTATTLARHIAIGNALIAIDSDNENRALSIIDTCLTKTLKGMEPARVWSCSNGFAGVANSDDPVAALRWVLEQPGNAIYVFLDLQHYWHDNPLLQRLLNDFATGQRPEHKCLVFIGSAIQLPQAVNRHAVYLDLPLPDSAEISAFIEQCAKDNPLLAQLLTQPGALSRLTTAARGLDLIQIKRSLRMLKIIRCHNLGQAVNAIHQEKKHALRRHAMIDFVDNDPHAASVGGMENLKRWLKKRERAFGKEENLRSGNLPAGILLMGISGCGKSLFVKTIAASWGLPLLRLDMATIYSGIHGTPEYSLQLACKTAETLSPCVLWIDEIEAGISEHGFKSGGGSASRVLGYFLTWMQEKRRPVFVAATANAIEMLPAEILRKGRFDEIFYLSLPNLREREEIFRIHLHRLGLDPEEFDPATLAHSSKGFSGAEIEIAISSASFEALGAERPLTNRDIMDAIAQTVPISVTMAEQIKKIEAWAFKRAVPASDPE